LFVSFKKITCSDRPIDLSSLVYEQTSVYSKASYLLLLVTSISSVCMDLAKILKWGDKPIIKSYFSLTFLKIFLFILTKFLVQSYVLSIAIKSLMYYVAMQADQKHNNDLYNNIFNLYYRGIDEDPQLLTFNQATLFAPIIILVLMFLPPVLCGLVFSFWHNGLRYWSENFVQNAALLLFAITSNMSYFSKRSPKRNYKPLQRSQSSLDLGRPPTQHAPGMYSSCSMPELNRPQTDEIKEKGKISIMNYTHVLKDTE
jgi:hypothetical protein